MIPENLHLPGGPSQSTQPQLGQQRAQHLVILIAGSGPTDRNGNSGSGPGSIQPATLQKIAEGLAAHGIASFRFDKLGVGKNRMIHLRHDSVRIWHFMAEVKLWATHLHQRFPGHLLHLAGHSEGSTLALMAVDKQHIWLEEVFTTENSFSLSSVVSSVVSIAGPGRPLQNILKEQLKVNGEGFYQTASTIIDSLTAGHTVKKIHPFLYALFRPENQPFLRSSFSISPTDLAKNWNGPLLILQGTTDIQVKKIDAELLYSSRSAPQVTKLVLVDGANHLLVKSDSSRNKNLETYYQPHLPIDSAVVGNMVSFFQLLPPKKE